jgi:hypothetical protein
MIMGQFLGSGSNSSKNSIYLKFRKGTNETSPKDYLRKHIVSHIRDPHNTNSSFPYLISFTYTKANLQIESEPQMKQYTNFYVSTLETGYSLLPSCLPPEDQVNTCGDDWVKRSANQYYMDPLL